MNDKQEGKRKAAPKPLVIAIGIAVISPLALMFVWLVWVGYADAHPEYGVALERVEWFPQEATNISYFKSYSYSAYEFDISEKGFETWASNWGQVEEIENPITMERYNNVVNRMEGLDYSWIPASESQTHVEISRGYHYEAAPRGNGGGTSIAYDSDKGRAYYRMSPR